MCSFNDGTAFFGAADGPMPLAIIGICLETRKKLGCRADLLDEYLFHIADRMTAVEHADIIQKGVGAAERLFSICHNLVLGGVPVESFSHKVVELIINRPLDIEDDITRAEVYALLLADEYFPIALSEVSGLLSYIGAKYKSIEKLNRLRGSMTEICGAEILDNLDRALHTSWQIVSPLQLFKQGYINELLNLMTNTDDNLQKTSLAFLLENLSKKEDT